MSKGWKGNSHRKQVEFREWFHGLCDDGCAYEYPIEAGTFKESGTNIETVLLVIRKV